MNTKSPFYVIENFISPLMCEDIVDICNFTVPDTDKDGNYIKTFKSCERAETILYQKLLPHLPEIQQYYSITYKGTEPLSFEWFPVGSKGEFICENSRFLRGKWLRINQRDLTGILFLSDFQDQPPIDGDYEVYGGRLEFVQHQFSFNPQRGTLIIFPSDPHFIHVTSDVFAGNAFQAKIQIAATTPLVYDPQHFPGDYRNWF